MQAQNFIATGLMMQSGDNDIHKLLFSLINASEDASINRTLEGIILSNIINFSDDAIFSTTLDGFITSWNTAAEKIFGYSRAEIIGKNVDLIIPASRKGDEPKIVERISKGEYVQHFETERRRKDGSLVCVSLTVSPLKDFQGRIIGISKISRDISARKKLQEVQQRLADLVNYSDDAIISLSLNGIIRSWNRGAEKIFGYSEAEALKRHYRFLLPSGKEDEVEKMIHRIEEGGVVEHYITERIRKDGAVIQVSMTVSPIKDLSGKVTGVSKIGRDISLQYKKDQEIQEKNKELETYTYSVSHDLRAPLRRTIQYLEMFQEDHCPALNESGQRLVVKIANNAHKMWRLIEDLLSFSQVTRQEISKTEVDLNRIVGKVVEECMHTPDGKAVAWDIAELGSVWADPTLLRQVFENLIGNAVKYSGKAENASVAISSYVEEGRTVVAVRDNGVGFDMRYAHKLFSVFQRLHSENEFPGSGVGLAIVKHIVSKHGGEVWATGQVNGGATFFFSLPRQTDLG